MQHRNSFSSDMTTSDGKALLRNNMQPKRKVRRAQQRQANKNHAKDLEERKRCILKKGPRKPFVPMLPKDVSILKIQYGRIIYNASSAIELLCVTGATLLKFIMISFKVLMACFRATAVSAIPRTSTLGAVIDEMTTSLTDEAASDVFRHGEESTSEKVGERILCPPEGNPVQAHGH
jgi:glyoxylate carboligase